jgi:hypothetical protein
LPVCNRAALKRCFSWNYIPLPTPEINQEKRER